jgi:hypothetical protein
MVTADKPVKNQIQDPTTQKQIPSAEPWSRKDTYLLIFCFFVVILVLGTLYLVLSGKSGKNNPLGRIPFYQTLNNRSNLTPAATPVPTPKPTPTPHPLVQGPVTYTIGTKQTPTPYEVHFNTIDPHSSTQTVELSVKDDSPISKVTAVVATDKLKNTYALTLKSGTKNDGVWTSSWNLKGDTYYKNLTITFKSSDAAGKSSSVDVTIR